MEVLMSYEQKEEMLEDIEHMYDAVHKDHGTSEKTYAFQKEMIRLAKLGLEQERDL